MEINMSDYELNVVKFGGTSLSTAEQFKKVADIIKADGTRRYVIPSAPGKRFPDDDKVTDMLYNCYELATKGNDISDIFSGICERFDSIIEGLGLDYSLEHEYEIIKSSIMHRAGRDYAASRGEYLNGKILSEYIGFDFIDASEVIFFSEEGKLDSEKTNTVLAERLRQHKNAVIPGFYGSMPNDTISTFSRGGSDITGSIVARAAEADIYENFTDVSGFLSADPRIVENPKPIDVITYRELRELSYMGATVLHEDSIFPVRIAGIPINIKNTNSPEDDGTLIVSSSGEKKSSRIITGIAGHSGFSILTLEKDMMNSEVGFGRRVLEVIEEEGLSFEHLPSGIDTMCVVISTDAISSCRRRLVDSICKEVNPDSVSITDGVSLIAVVGKGMINNRGTAARIFTALANAGINIKMIDQGSSEFNIIVGVSDEDFAPAQNAIYHEFFD